MINCFVDESTTNLYRIFDQGSNKRSNGDSSSLAAEHDAAKSVENSGLAMNITALHTLRLSRKPLRSACLRCLEATDWNGVEDNTDLRK